MRLYKYKGTISGNAKKEVWLYNSKNGDIAPTRLTVLTALRQYIDALCSSDSEERYYEKEFIYDELLMLIEIRILCHGRTMPVKIITQSRLMSDKPEIFGRPELMETEEEQLEPMSISEYNRYQDFRYENPYDDFYNVLPEAKADDPADESVSEMEKLGESLLEE